MNLWKGIPAGDNPPKIVNVVVEVESRSRDKYEYNRELGVFVLDRVLHSSVVFPVDYGFIPQTWCEDGDPLDIMILSYEPLKLGCVIKVRPIGLLIMEDEAGLDCKILSVPINDPRFNKYCEIKDVPPHLLEEIEEFFKTYKRLEPKKWVKVKGWKNRKEAEKVIMRAIELYKKKCLK